MPLHWWPLTRDCTAYGFTVTVLICIIHDERVEWFEALVLVILYIVYIGVMYWDKKIQKCARTEGSYDEDSFGTEAAHQPHHSRPPQPIGETPHSLVPL